MAKGDEITTKFKVDISDLKSGIAEANQEIKLANAEFKAATAGMDDWSKSADGIKAKLNQLESVLSAQKTKLEAYNEQLNRQQKAYDENGKRAEELRAQLENLAKNGVEKTSDEYKKYETALNACEAEQEKNKKSLDALKITVLDQQAAVNKTEAELGKYTTALDDLEKSSNEADKETEDLTKSVKESGKSAEDSAGGFSVLKGALADLVASGIKAAIQGLKDLAKAAGDAWNEFDAGRDTLIKLTGAQGDTAENLLEVYSRVSKKIVADSDVIGSAVGEVNTRFGSMGYELEYLSEKYLKFAEVADMDIVGAIDDTQKALSAYGKGANDADQFLDSLLATSQRTGVEIPKLTGGIISNATAFQEMGLSLNQAVAFMGELETSGVNSETVLNGMRKALKNSAEDGLSLNESLLSLQDAIEGNVDGVDGLTAAYELFGKSGDQIFGAIANGSLSFRDLTEAAEESAGAVENTFAATKDASDSLKLVLQNLKIQAAETIDQFLQENGPQLEEMLQQLADVLLPAISAAIEGISSAVVWIMNNIDWIAPLVGILGGVAAAIGVVTTAQTALNAVMSANPIGLVITAIAALVAAFVYLWNNCEEFREFWINLWEKVKEIAEKVWKAITEFFTKAWDTIKNAFAKTKEFFKEKFESARDAVKNAWKNAGNWFKERKEQIQNAFATVDKFMGDKFGGAWDAVKLYWKASVNWFKNIWESIKAIFAVVQKVLAGDFQGAWDEIKKIVDKWKDYFKGIWDGIKSVFKPVGDFFKETFDKAKDAVKAPINFIIRGLNTLIKGINKIGFDVPDWVPVIGGQKWGFNIPEIPELARGGVLRRGQLGLLEGSGAEAVVPLENNAGWIHNVAADLLRQIAAVNGGSVTNIGGNRDYSFTQIINAPEAPSRIEIYRQTRNLLAYAKAAGGV